MTLTESRPEPAAEPAPEAAQPAPAELWLTTARARLGELLEEWEPGEHPELGQLIIRVARTFVFDTGQLERVLRAPAVTASATAATAAAAGTEG